MKIDIKIPKKLLRIFKKYRYKILYGGRSSGKSASVIRYLIVRAMQKKTKILCTREFQSSIQHSTYAELRDLIYELNLHYDAKNNPDGMFIVKSDGITCTNGSEFIFKGLARDIMQIKSIPNIDICFVEEADTISNEHWEILIPTIRAEDSEIIVCFNPRERLSATYQRFIEAQPADNELRIEINYDDNPFNSETILQEIERLKIHDYARYEHIYLGKVLDMTEDVIFKGKTKILDMNIERINDCWLYNGKRVEMLYGMDFGFSTDPAAMVELCLLDANTIYIHREIYETKLLPSKYCEKIKGHMPEGLKEKWFADCSRPDTIADLKHQGLRIEGAEKLKGSVESGIEWLQGKTIIINPSCKNMIYEAHNYKYKTDKLTGKITTDIIDANNHLWDAIRYACVKLIQVQGSGRISDKAIEGLLQW